MHVRLLAAALVFTLYAPLHTAGAQARDTVAPATTMKDRLTPQERGFIAKTLTRRFAPEIAAKGQDVSAWARKFGRLVGSSDAVNVQNAAKMPTLTTATAVLLGQPVTSASIQAALSEIRSGAIGPAALGSVDSDTVYTPLPGGRCRVADSRVINAPLSGGETRQINVETISSYASQGGSGSSAGDGSFNCKIPEGTAALAVSITVLSNGQEGIFKIFPTGVNYTQGNTVYYTSVVSAANDVIVKSCQTCDLELEIFSSANVHYVLDVIGYFMQPSVTALSCKQTPTQVTALAASGGTGTAVSAACDSGYTRIRTNCETATFNTFLSQAKDGSCSAKNTGTTASEVRASSTCCRIPGR